MPAFPPMDFSIFDWKANPDDPSCYSRLNFGGETFQEVSNHFESGQHTLFFGFKVTFTDPTPAPALLARARETWETLRFDVPTIAARTDFDGDLWQVHTVYHVAKNFEQIKEWSERVVKLAEGLDSIDELRYVLSQKRIPDENGDQTFLHVLPMSDSTYGFLIHTHHTPFDGSAIQLIVNEFLTRLATPAMNGPSSLAWGTESKNLPPPTPAVLCASEATEGPLYEQGLQALVDSLLPLPHRIGFKERNIGPGPTRRAEFVFSEDETKKIITAVRAQGGTFNQFAHAAVCILCYQDNPTTEATSPDAVYVCPSLTDSRNRLLPCYEKHMGYVLGINAVSVPVSALASLAPEGEREQLLKVAQMIKVEYELKRGNPALLGCQPQFGYFLFDALKTIPPGPDFGFNFSGDGIGEKHMNRSFQDNHGQVYVTLDDYFTAVNRTDPAPVFRPYTWRGKLRLSIDYNEHAMPKDVIQGFLDKWTALLRLV